VRVYRFVENLKPLKMKNLTLLTTISLLIFVFTSRAQDTIPNNNFEYWLSNTNPENWNTVNDLLPFGNAACFQSTDGYEGDYALFMKTIDLDGLIVPGVTSLGTIGMGFTEGGVPFQSRPESLSGYFKHPSTGDMVMLAIEFFKNGEIIGFANWATSDSIPDYTQFTVPITFTSAEEPDTMNITILTDQNVLGSALTLDALSFTFPPVNVEELKSNNVEIYPNPCFDFLNFTSEKNVRSVEVLTLSGDIIYVKQNMEGASKLDMRDLPKGLYILRFSSDEAIFQQKIVKN
jgi:hypothetical protein